MIKLKRENVEDILPLTSMQSGLLFHHIRFPESKQYFDQIVLYIQGDLDEEVIKASWDSVIMQNPALRTKFRWKNISQPIQIIVNDVDDYFTYIHVPDDSKETVGRVCSEEQERLCLETHPFRIAVCYHSTNQAFIIVSAHRILMDGWSTSIVLQEFFDNYQRIILKKEINKREKCFYKEYFTYCKSLNCERMKQYWNDYLKRINEKAKLPYANEIAPSRKYQCETYVFSKEIYDKICLFTRNYNITLSSFFYGVWGLILCNYNNLDEILFGTLTSNRPHDTNQFNDVVGLFINTIPLLVKMTEEDTVLDYFDRINQDSIERLEYGQLSYDDIVKCRSDIQGGLFDSIIVVENYPFNKQWVKNEYIQLIKAESNETTNFNLTIQLQVFHKLNVSIFYDEALYNEESITQLARLLEEVSEKVILNFDQLIREFEIVSDEEKSLILKQFNQSDKNYPQDETIVGLVSKQALLHGDNIAVQCDNTYYTYEKFIHKIDCTASMLLERGVQHGDKVILYFGRNLNMIVSIMAILRIGAVCIPLDISYPMDRTKYIIEDSNAHVVLKDRNLECKVERSGIKVIDYAEEAEVKKEFPEVRYSDEAFIIYTSGSTGGPKGTILTHQGIICHLYTKNEVFQINENDVVANIFSINVIAALWQVFCALTCGGKVIIYSREIEIDPYRLFETIDQDKVTIVELIPSQLYTYLFQLQHEKKKIQLNHLTRIGLTSEPTSPQLVQKFYAEYKIQLINCYGQTECSDDVLHYKIPYDEQLETIPLGTPLQGTKVIILNKHDKMQKVGFPGEICVAGDSVCLGYYKRDKLNREKFIKSDYIPEYNIYRTGDYGRWNKEGVVTSIGRIDNQVKVRGNRIELQEIDHQMMEYKHIINVATVLRKGEVSDSIVSFFEADQKVSDKDVKQFLEARLPLFMIPSDIIQLQKLPLTANGKVNKKQLVKYNLDSVNRVNTLPRNQVEDKVTSIVKNLLQKEEVDINTSLFDLGADSLLLAKIKTVIDKEFDKSISVVDLFKAPTIAEIAKLIMGNKDMKGYAVATQENGPDSGNGDIAIVGLSLRVPGANHADEFWNNLKDGVNSITCMDEVTPERSKYCGILGDIELLDTEFFGISAREAEIMDPQQRVFLVQCWNALEDAGYNPFDNQYSIGLFASSGVNTYYYENILNNKKLRNDLGEFQLAICNEKDNFATKISYKLNLTGPSVTVQSACSSSLVSVHLANQALQNKECYMALAGGINIRYPEKNGYLQGGHVSPNGICNPFDETANGTVFSNGAGVILLKRLSDAERDHDHIYAVIKGSAVNNDGLNKNGYTSPNEIGQANVIRQAIRNANIPKDSISYVETHGTGTALGDSIEFRALNQVFESDKKAERKCALGTLKANIGHLDVASGIVGLIKMILCLRNKYLPPNINFQNPNASLDFDQSPFYINTEGIEWTTSKVPRRGGVSSFGIGGTNSHVILEEYISHSKAEKREGWSVVPVSAETSESLYQMIQNLLAHLRENEIDLYEIAYTLQTGRRNCKYRTFFVSNSKEMLISQLADYRKENCNKCNISTQSDIIMVIGDISFENIGSLYRKYREIDEFCNALNLLVDQSSYITNDIYEITAYNSPENYVICQLAVLVFELALKQYLSMYFDTPLKIIGVGIGEYALRYLDGELNLNEIYTQLCQQDLKDSIQHELLECKISQYQMAVVIGNPGKRIHSILSNIKSVNFTNIRTATSQFLNQSFGILWENGVKLDWDNINKGREVNRVSLPTYSFDDKIYTVSKQLEENSDYICFLPTYKQVIVQKKIENKKELCYFIFSEKSKISEAVIREISAHGHSIIVIKAGLAYEKINAREYVINSDNQLDYQRLFQSLSQNNYVPDRIIHFWGISGKETNSVSSFSLSVYSLMYLVQGITEYYKNKASDIFMVSEQCAAIESSDICNPWKAVIKSACKVVMSEYKNLNCYAIDIGNRNLKGKLFNNMIYVLSEICQCGILEDNIAIRGKKIWQEDYLEITNEEVSVRDLTENGVYVITGGMGNIGQKIAVKIAETVKATIILLSRKIHVMSEEVDLLEHIRDLGSKVIQISADCTDYNSMLQAMSRITEDFGHVHGIFHCAGVTSFDSFKLIQDMNTSDCESQFGVKIQGSIILKQMIDKYNVGFCILFSSYSARVGGIGFYSYSIANAFMSALATSCSNSNILSIEWGAWELEQFKKIPHKDVYSIDAENAMKILFTNISKAGQYECVVARGSHKKKKDSLATNTNLTNILMKKEVFQENSKIDNDISMLREIWEKLLGVKNINVEDDFFELGGDSLLAIQLKKLMEKEFHVNVSLDEFMDRPTIEELTEQLARLN